MLKGILRFGKNLSVLSSRDFMQRRFVVTDVLGTPIVTVFKVKGILRNVCWYLVAGVSEKPIDPLLKRFVVTDVSGKLSIPSSRVKGGHAAWICSYRHFVEKLNPYN